MEIWLRDIFDWLPTGPLYYSILGLIALLESLALVGIFVPGSVLIVFAGFLAAHGQGALLPLMAVCALGSLLGDLFSYYLGARLGSSLRQRPLFVKRQALLNKAQLFFTAHGGKSVFAGRFVGFLRPFIPFVAGSAHMPPLAFGAWALISAILWGIAYPGLGYLFAASWQLVEIWTGRFSLLILVLILLFLGNTLFWRYLMPLLGRWVCRWGRGLALRWQACCRTAPMTALQQRWPRLWSFVAGRFCLQRASGLYLTAGLSVSACFALFFAWVVRDILFPSQLIHFDHLVYGLIQHLRHPGTDAFFLLMTFLGDGQVILMLSALTCIWLVLFNRDFSAAILVAGLIGGETLVFLLKHAFNRPRPEPFFTHLVLDSASFPSAHAFVALVFYGLLVYLLLGTLSNLQGRFTLILLGSFLTLLIGCSRIYLGVHWLSDVVGGFLLAALWLSFLITAAEARRQYGGEFPWRRGPRPLNIAPGPRALLLTAATLATLWGVGRYAWIHLPQDLQTRPPTITWQALPPGSDPAQMLAVLPTFSESFSGQRRRPLSLIVIAPPGLLTQTLTAGGWQPAAPLGLLSFGRSYFDLLHAAPDPAAPVLPRFVNGKPQDLALSKPVPAGLSPSRRVLLGWQLGYRDQQGREAWGLLISYYPEVKRIFGFPLPLPLLDPDVDQQRQFLAREFATAGALQRLLDVPLNPPLEGEDVTGNPFHSDGQIGLLWLETPR